MIKKIIATTVFMLSSTVLLAGESTSNREFVVKNSPDVIMQWMKDHPKEVAKSTGCDIISTNKDEMRLSQSTPVGVMDFTVKEKFTENSYSSKLVKVHRGSIQDQTILIEFIEKNNETKVTIKLYAKVDDVFSILVKSNLNKSTKGFQDLLQKEFRK